MGMGSLPAALGRIGGWSDLGGGDDERLRGLPLSSSGFAYRTRHLGLAFRDRQANCAEAIMPFSSTEKGRK